VVFKIALRKKRSTEPETIFGDIKNNRDFRRVSLNDLKKLADQ